MTTEELLKLCDQMILSFPTRWEDAVKVAHALKARLTDSEGVARDTCTCPIVSTVTERRMCPVHGEPATPPTDALVEALDKALELLSVPEHAQDEAWERKYYEVVEVHNRYVPKDGQTHAEPPAATVPESIHEAADIILEVADYINDACNDGTGILGSKSVDPLMRAHALLGDAAPQSGKKEDGDEA